LCVFYRNGLKKSKSILANFDFQMLENAYDVVSVLKGKRKSEVFSFFTVPFIDNFINLRKWQFQTFMKRKTRLISFNEVKEKILLETLKFQKLIHAKITHFHH
jgi:hypothetical protein